MTATIRSSLLMSILLVVASAVPALGADDTDGSGSDSSTAHDASAKSSEHEGLATTMQNPFADLITFPLQNITSFDVGPDDGHTNVLNLQPVVPIQLNDSWDLLARPILPISYTSVPESEFGLGDLNLEPFLSPRKAGNIAWGVGAILGVPTATGDALGTGKWTAGPSVAVFAVEGHWALSIIANQQWSYAGDSDRDEVSLLQLQPTVTYILRHGWFIYTGPLISADWTEPSGQEWTVPAGAGFGRVFAAGTQKLSLQLEAYTVPIRPDDGPESMVLVTLTFLFPQ